MKLKILLLFILLSSIAYSQSRTNYKRRIYSNQIVDIIEKKHLQIESQAIFEKNIGISNTFYLTDNHLRYGLNEDLEIIADIDILYSDDLKLGILPISFGIKVNILEESKKLPEISVIGKVQTKNVGTENYQISTPLPNVTFILNKNLSKKISTELDLNLQWLENAELSYTVDNSYNYSFSDNTSLTIGFLNIFNQSNYWNPMIESGIEQKLSTNFSLTLETGKYFNNMNQDYYFAFGIIKNFNLNKKKI